MGEYQGVKIIHQTWEDDSIPEKWEASPREWKRLHPDWEYKLWTNDERRKLFEEHLPDYVKYYDRFPYHIQRIDAVRYLILYLYGGVYSDLDHVPLKNIGEQLVGMSCDIFLTTSANVSSYYANCFMIAYKPRCPFWLHMLEYTKRMPAPYHLWKHSIVMNTTGPNALTAVANAYNGPICKLPAKLWNPATVSEIAHGTAKDVALKNDAVCYNLEGGSWMGSTAKIFFFVIRHLVIITIVLLIVFIFIVFKCYCAFFKCRPQSGTV